MQVKIIIGTIAFMLTMIILGAVSLTEPGRLEVFSDAFEGRSVENGAELYVNNCASCHGVNGRAEACFDPATGEPTGCIGRSLNNADLLCGTRSQRMDALDWGGTKFDFIESTIAAGRPWNGMPTWGERFGGPLPNNYVNDVTLFVLNWESQELCGEDVVVEGPVWPLFAAELPTGNPENGAQLYEVTYACQSCHGDLEDEATALVGPWLGDIEGRVPLEGYTAADYLYESILMPNAYISLECPNGPCGEPSAMPGNFGERMTLQEMADVMAFILGETEFESNVEVEYPEGAVPPQTLDE
ncbi:MAG: c-type cytochrome [Candidatus Promineifilaceae bacterium]|nr:c-type cytochrome [Candidatus Promineifilaceae bacterium]